MPDTPKAAAAAAFLWRAHKARETYANLPPEFAPADAAEAYAAQEAFQALAAPTHGPVAGMKIATTTKVMQRLMGIDHPIGGGIFSRRIFASPATVSLAGYVNLRLECEVAVLLATSLAGDDEVTPALAMHAVSHVAPAFELIEDRKAVYKQTRALSLIADNAWNGGIVHGAWRSFDPEAGLGDIEGVLTIDGIEKGRGKPDGPFEALAWLANLARSRGRPLQHGMTVITGSIIATFDAQAGSEIVFSLGPWGEARMRAE